ncbi:copper ABC superfamily ATP binding cassette transporter, membrane domain protein [Neisseria gonorrhoeae]|nr:copper ABC superfamily ATP binding cassette transporter, membrane domain protein [Neisseria gonorrhoeae]
MVVFRRHLRYGAFGYSGCRLEQVITAPVVETVLLFNPTDIYRLLNLTGYENTAMYAGMAGLSGQIG